MIPSLYCADPLNPRAVDDHFATEAAGARADGVRVALLDHDALLAGDAGGAVRRVPAGLGPVWYRGWMIPAGRYEELDAALSARGVRLLDETARYRAAHELPGWYDVFAGLTPASVWTGLQPGEVPDADRLARLVGPLPPGAGVVKDFVKSRKHEWDEACYVPDLRDATRLAAVVARFVELQDDALAGGVVVRAFEPFDGRAEARVWWLDGEPVLVGPHPDTPDVVSLRELPPDLAASLRAAVRRLGCRFVTTDLARRTDGRWRVVEVGDGQVSDLPRSADPLRLTEPLAHAPSRVVTR